MRPDVNRFRARVGLRPIKDLLLDGWASHLLNLIAVSPALCAGPPDWPAWNQVCGFLALPPTGHEAVSPELASIHRRRSAAGVHGIWQPHAVAVVAPDRDGCALEGSGADGGLPRDHPGRTWRHPLLWGCPMTRVTDRQPHAARAGVSAVRGGGAPLRRRHDAYDAARPACLRFRCRTSPINSSGLTNFGASAWRRRRSRDDGSRRRGWPRESARRCRIRDSRENARQIQARMKDDDGPGTAARLIESAFATGRFGETGAE